MVPEPILRSIPASAGKPSQGANSIYGYQVHPRECGEAIRSIDCLSLNIGPSPRVRGSHTEAFTATVTYGSIPASAGKPSSNTREV